MEPGDKVVAILNWDRVSLKVEMTGYMKFLDIDPLEGDSIVIVWNELLDEYPDGIYHYLHHLNYVFAMRG
jgi:hypothetical protein